MFKAHREEFLKQMGPGVAVLPTNPVAHRSADVDFEYRPDSDFYYLTGFEEPEAVAVISSTHRKHRFVLFVRPRNPEQETWTGRRAGPEGVLRDYGADAAFPLSELESKLPEYLENVETLYYALGKDAAFDNRMTGWLNAIRAKHRAGVSAPGQISDPRELLHEMRLIKGEEEITRMRRAAAISGQAHREALQALRPGLHEYETEATLEAAFRRQGASGPSYPSIVGSGPNSCILHYNTNNRRMEPGDLVLIDAACEYGMYAADITRTWPVSGRFSREQKAVYEVVLRAQKTVIDRVRPGESWNALHEQAVQILTEGLVDLGLLEGPVPRAVETGAYKKYYMHRTGHWLGMDVHDVGKYQLRSQWRKLEPGMVFTVEPGLYITPGLEGVSRTWWGIGVRIEDDILVTPKGHEVLTGSAPKEIAEIESLLGGRVHPAGISSSRSGAVRRTETKPSPVHRNRPAPRHAPGRPKPARKAMARR